jgi:predicted PurR-regulated permease PerM
MRKIISLLVLALIINLTILSISYGQNNVNIGGIVPVTEFNKNSTKQQINVKNQNPTPAQNVYLYFFEKTLGLQTEAEKNQDNPTDEAQTVYDQVYSSLLLWVLMFVVAVIVLFILRIIDRVILRLRKSKRKIRR